MSNAPAAAAPQKGKKKLLLVVLAGAVLLAAAGGGALLLTQKKSGGEHAADEADAPPAPQVQARARRDPKALPVFVPLDAFTVNLADRDAERYAQVGITFEIDDAKEGERIKSFMPVIRNNILMLLAHKTSEELLGREGKVRLARDVQREAARALGFEVDDDDEDDDDADAAAPSDAEKPKKKRKKKRRAPLVGPVQAVHFSNFIIQ